MQDQGSISSRLSQRALDSLAAPVPLRAKLIRALPELYHPTLNPTGAINMGLAHNDLMQKDIMEKLSTCLEFQTSDLEYGDPHGSRVLRGLVADLMNRHFNPVIPLHFRNITVVPGAGAAVWQLVQSLADPGDSVMVLAPYYGNFDLDVCVSTGVKLIPIYPHHSMDGGIDMDLLNSTKIIGTKCKVLLITNPRNPHGCCYSVKDMKHLLTFASKHSLHVIFDEVYGLSTFNPIPGTESSLFEPFTSVLSIANIEQWIAPQLVHVVYGMSKDFCLNGLRLGFIVDQYNADLRSAVTLSSMFGYMSTLNDRLVCNLLKDTTWIDWFVNTNRQRLYKAYELTTKYLEQLGIEYIPSGVGPFIVVKIDRLFKNHGQEISFEIEEAIWETALLNGVYIAQGYVFHCLEPGYFRLTYSLEWDHNNLHMLWGTS
ncbi:pyridoxal phosphate-dependent transferase [Halteromyces radiatus]|uniref:pyridoxal phosphate-dependent transferase n=1 Tax=Halteromyces radiatus TaxID=101107 RepID=UPI00221FFFEB|nr:pyridoxal phosphate-dependent transferase [Halteromyces radiatus]KAI8085096.1 pyridoxal phosphate-dependent transferase [Halteromyces radiatus]